MQLLATYLVRGLIIFGAVATLLPVIKVGYWPVRLCDFFRFQIALVSFALVLGIAIWCSQSGQWRQWDVWMVVGLAIGVWQISHVVPYTPLWKKEVAAAGTSAAQTLSVAVVNLKFENKEKQQVLDQLKKLDVKLLLLIELNEAWQDALQPVQSEYPHRHGVVRDEGLGLMLWSKIPLEDAETRHLVSKHRASIFTSVRLDPNSNGHSQKIRFVGVHPLPPGLPEKHEQGRHDSRVRDAELMLIAKEVSQSPDDFWVVTGDFNDVAWSHTTRLFQRLSGLADPRVGRGLYNTYHANYPWIRFPIDQVFLSPGARIHQLGRFHPHGSDHFAITTEFSFEHKAPPPESSKDGDREEAEEIIEEGHDDARKNQ